MDSRHPFQDLLSNYFQVGQTWMDNFQTPTQSTICKSQFDDWSKMAQSFTNNPSDLLSQQMNWWNQQVQLFNDCILSSAQSDINERDPRFRDESWSNNALYRYIKESYKLASDNILSTISNHSEMDEQAKERLEFFARQFINAMSPSNFVTTNPEVMKLTLESNGQNLIKGFEQLQKDMNSSVDMLNIRMTDTDAFKLGENIAVTPGKVVFKNHLFELIQYQPTTEQVYKRPLMIVPPFVNKYYIMDLSQKRSFVKWLVDQGHTVFMVSWVNPDASYSDTDFGTYVTEGLIPALDAIEAETGEREVNGLGYCIGGTLLTTTMAYLAGKRRKQRIKSATLLTTILDFSQPGELGVFINDPMISAIETQNNAKGYIDGRQMAVSFSLLRENSLYWNYYVTNYLKGESPIAFDLLHWNCDNTNVPAQCHNQMLRQFYLENRLSQPGEFVVDGVTIDLSKVKSPVYFLSAIEDHIALWKGTYKGNQLISGKSTFVLAESGHIAGPMNHANSTKYGYWTNENTSTEADEWLENADKHTGSWWPHLQTWLDERNFSEKLEAKALEGELDAPGTYVKQRIEEVLSEEKESKDVA
ncbi:class I poly(R)-hydroxyalkanoic acid synthase [Vibrio sp. ZSDZ34]|uniref:Class I poly(R)-hydroxyalkanoic acid synthase n=1 Tax=Vibrio gelatinilyticus TaxID=2893468 RepID=A0A9X1WCR6_9VIBR|nr:class I poly(R)-hydroxyalkanoic acid synthase [Vibrio gelatinilyticus]MCJ2377030.1 class I poly(R)-hydroxyalkanoic acid synthase [Vibrio gelatinilyticus]